MAKTRRLIFLTLNLVLPCISWSTTGVIDQLDSIRKIDPKYALEFASKYFDDELKSADKADLFYWRGKVFFSDLNDKEGAIINFYNALKYFRQTENKSQQYASLTYLALSYQSLYHYDYAIQYYQEITDLEKLDSLSLVKTKFNLGQVSRMKEQFVVAQSYVEECLNYFQSKGLEKKVRNATLELALIHLENKSINEAKSYYQIALELASDIADSVTIGRSLNSLGYIAFLEEQYELSEELLLRALNYKWNSKNQQTHLMSFINLGRLYKVIDRPNESKKWYLKAASFDPSFVNHKNLIGALNELANSSEKQGDLIAALDYKNQIQNVLEPYLELNERLKILHSQYRAERVYQLNANKELQSSLALQQQRLIIICLASLLLLIGILWLAQNHRRLRRVDDNLIIYLKRHVKVLNRIGQRYPINIDEMLSQVEKEEQGKY